MDTMAHGACLGMPGHAVLGQSALDSKGWVPGQEDRFWGQMEAQHSLAPPPV